MPPTMRRARRRLQQPAQHADRRRLPGAVAAEESEDLAASARRTTRRRRRRTRRTVASDADVDGDGRSDRSRGAHSGPVPASWSHRPLEPRVARRAFARARVRSSSAWSTRARASSTSVLVATPARNRSSTTRRASAALRTPSVGRVNRGAAGIQFEPALLHLEGDLPIELGDARLRPRASARRPRPAPRGAARRPRAAS